MKKKPGFYARLFLCSLVEYRLIDIQPGNFSSESTAIAFSEAGHLCGIPCPPIVRNLPGSAQNPAITRASIPRKLRTGSQARLLLFEGAQVVPIGAELVRLRSIMGKL